MKFKDRWGITLWLTTLIVALLPNVSTSQVLYKCVGKGGRVSYQAIICNENTKGSLLQGSNRPNEGKASPADAGGQASVDDPESLKQRVLDRLKDPGSAQFQELRVLNDGRVLCGKVNAKNSYGGYIGFKRFVSDHEGAYFEGDGSGPADKDSYNARRTFYPKAYRYGCL